jgi:hypothetical protein
MNINLHQSNELYITQLNHNYKENAMSLLTLLTNKKNIL